MRRKSLVSLCMMTICCREVRFVHGWEELQPRLLSTDESYWTRGHLLSEQLGCCPIFFPKELSSAVFMAGKSLRLLKLCNPKVGVADCMCC